MRFGAVPLVDAQGAILAHSVQVQAGRLRKGRVLSADDLAALQEAGLSEITVARLDPGDVEENAAAMRLAQALVPDPRGAGLTVQEAFTGRVNIRADRRGVVLLDAEAVHRLNAVDPMITLATVPPMQRSWPGMMVGTVKIISYGVDGAALAQAEKVARGAMQVCPVSRHRATLIVTEVAGRPVSAEDKGIRAVQGRLDALGITLDALRIVPHEAGSIASALRAAKGDLSLILTASATSDIHDEAPAAVVAAGGEIARFGMPVDPGNLLFLGRIGTVPVIGLPGCARSPALNGADWVLERIACGLAVEAGDIAAMGVGGLLKEIPQRPQPRAGRST
ncbi:molybdopterin-binding protein [Nioella nitratireducens]|uniref:molybdopterin-binding protein n=1 Tax=Nioella nitratireducens TaxID=1287720 RepID=UPI0008FD74B9|nr:molybdopterin-binding protein [Nioella nitratireducens]